MSRSKATGRGYTIAELLSVIFLLGLLMSAIVLILGPLLRAQHQTQAKVDTVQAAAMALYRVQRDLRNTDALGIFVCTTGSSPSCTSPFATITPTSAIVITTAYANGTGPFQFDATSGTPVWQGATVYWVDSEGNLDVAFDWPSGFVRGASTITSTQAAAAVRDVTTAGGMQLARFVERLALAEPPASHIVSLQLQAQSTDGEATNETAYQTDLETRN
jgi:type II secretory pathway pseudopilin PulG